MGGIRPPPPDNKILFLNEGLLEYSYRGCVHVMGGEGERGGGGGVGKGEGGGGRGERGGKGEGISSKFGARCK